MRKLLFPCLLVSFFFTQVKAQQYGLFNTKTLFDGFENPAQKTFVLDSSRKFASNFFLPYFGLNASNKGNNDVIRRLISNGRFSAKDVPIGVNELNTVSQNSNIYIFNLKIFKSYKYHKELAFSWQLRTDVNARYTNETLVVFDDYQRLYNLAADYKNPFNNNGYAQTYHQFSISYRENYTKKLAFGVKLSLLSGLTYNQLKISNSEIIRGATPNEISLRLQGRYRASFLKSKELSRSDFIPTFKNPGIAASFGTTYTAKNGILLMANIKDLGVIRWANSSYVNDINSFVTITDPKKADDQIEDIAVNGAKNKSFYSLTNAKADFLISKTYSFYTPSIIVSKNLFYRGGDVALINRFRYNDFSVSAIPTYNFNDLLLVGMQAMYQTPNFEVFLGSDNLFKSVSQINGAIKQDVNIGTGYNGAAFYMGVGIKFGYTVEHPQNSSYIPGLDDQETGFFKRIFSIFSRRK